jgi:alpha-glucosidase
MWLFVSCYIFLVYFQFCPLKNFKFKKNCRRYLEQSGEEESICMEGDIGGGLVLQRQISILKDNPKIVQIDSSIQARSVGAGSGGFSR